MAIYFQNRFTLDYNSPDATTGLPTKNKYLDFIDSETGETLFTIAHSSDGTATAEVDTAQCVTDDTVAVKKATVTLTNAQIKALPTTPIEIVPAPGAGKAIFTHSAFMSYAFAGYYTNYAAYTNWYLETTSGRPVTVTTSAWDVLDAGSDMFARLGPNDVRVSLDTGETAGAYDNGDLSAADNNAVQLSMYNGVSGNLTGGNAANALTVTVLYSVIDA